MHEKLEETINLAEKATVIYLNYIDKYSKNWTSEQLEEATQTLGELTVFCHELNNKKKNLNEKGLPIKDEFFKAMELIEENSKHIISELSPFLVK